MTRSPISIAENTKLKEAELLFKTLRIRHLPVTNGKKLIGLVSERDLLRALPFRLSELDSDEAERIVQTTPVSTIMTRKVCTIRENTPVIQATRILLARKIGCLPVVESAALVGIFTYTDALRLLVRMREIAEDVPAAVAT